MQCERKMQVEYVWIGKVSTFKFRILGHCCPDVTKS